MKNWIKLTIAALAGALLGAVVILAALRARPDAAQGWLAGEGSRHKALDPSVLPFPAAPPKEDDDSNAAPARPFAGIIPGPQSGAPDVDDDDEAFFRDPLKEMAKIHEEMDKQMRAQLNEMPGFGGEGTQGVVKKEDDRSVSYEISGVDATKLSTSVKNGYLTIAGEARRETGGSTMQTSFRRMFPLPAGVDAAKMETTSEKDKVILRFPKRKTG